MGKLDVGLWIATQARAKQYFVLYRISSDLFGMKCVVRECLLASFLVPPSPSPPLIILMKDGPLA